LDTADRLETMQTIENCMAEIQNRPACDVITEEMQPNEVGGYRDGEIIVNAGALNGNDVPVAEHFDTIVHEGRHAYQEHAVNNSGVVSDPQVVEAWAENRENYITPDAVDWETYVNQPIE